MAVRPESHLVLSRKWRPERLSELVGQEAVAQTLTQALKSGRVAHAFLFAGIRGVGKTSAARILAKCLNCERGVTPEPCGECPSCVEIRAGRSLDVVEIDGATYRKIDDARAIIENLAYRPSRDRFKVYIIDEAHQLTDQAFNALLKTLEEPPPHVKFVLATTEPQKVPETILSRLQRYDFRRLPTRLIAARLKDLVRREQADADDEALALIAREAGGSMRDAERTLETMLAAAPEGKISEAVVAATLGVASRSAVLDLVEKILKRDARAAFSVVRDLHLKGTNLESLGRDLLQTLRNLVIAKLDGPDHDGAASLLDELPDEEVRRIRELAGGSSMRDLMRRFRLMVQAQEEISRLSFPELILEMAVVRMATLAEVLDADELMRAVRNAAATASGPAGGSSQGPGEGSRVDEAESEKLRRSRPTVASHGRRRESDKRDFRQVPITGEISVRSEPGSPESVADEGEATDMPDFRAFIRSRKAALAGFMEHGAGLKVDGDKIILTPRREVFLRYFRDNLNELNALAKEFFQREIAVVIGSDAQPAAAAHETGGATASAPEGEEEPQSRRPDSNEAGSEPAAQRLRADLPQADPTDRPDGKTAREEARSALYSQPVVRELFERLQARFVGFRDLPTVKKVDSSRELSNAQENE